jgi:hypothetical protein
MTAFTDAQERLENTIVAMVDYADNHLDETHAELGRRFGMSRYMVKYYLRTRGAAQRTEGRRRQ